MAREQQPSFFIDKVAEEAFLRSQGSDRLFYQGLLERYYSIMEEVDRIHGLQLAEGFYQPATLTEDGLVKASQDPTQQPQAKRLSEPDTLVRLRGNILVAKDYNDLPQFKKPMDQVAKLLTETTGYVKREANGASTSRETDLISLNLTSLAPAFRDGLFRASRYALYGMPNFPKVMLDVGWGDRYDDKWGLKLSAEGWIIARDDEMTEALNSIAKLGMASLQNEFKLQSGFKSQLYVGDAIAMTGLAKVFKYRGNTMPSEEDLRKELALAYIFKNNVRQRVLKVLAPRYSDFIQGEGLSVDEIFQAVMLMMTGHELIGHGLVDVGNPENIRTHFTSVKETGAESLGQSGLVRAIGRSPLTSEVAVTNAIYTSFEWAATDLEARSRRLNPTKDLINHPYEVLAAVLKNYHRVYRSTEEDKLGRIRIPALERLETNSRLLAKDIRSATHSETDNPGTTDAFLKYWANNPVQYIGEWLTPPNDTQTSNILAA